MAAPKGNQYWKLANMPGYRKSFESPEELYRVAKEYFEYTDQRFIAKEEWKGKPLKKVTTKLRVPYTYSSWYLFAGISHATWKRYRENEEFKGYREIVDYIDETIYNNKYEGAVVGMFNALMISRDLKLTEHTETKSVSVNKFDTSSLSKEDKELLFDLSLKMKSDVR